MEAAEFVEVKGFAARGKRATNFEVDQVEEVAKATEEEPETPDAGNEETADGETLPNTVRPARSEEDLMDELTGQGHLFDDF